MTALRGLLPEDGTRAELLRLQGAYARLISAQSR